MENVYVPIQEQGNMLQIIDHCLEKDGQKEGNSRSLKLDGYRPPRNSSFLIYIKKLSKIKYGEV